MITAKIKVNSGRTEGKVSSSDESTKVLKNVLNEIKGIGGSLQKMMKLDMSGLSGKAALIAATVAAASAVGLITANEIKQGQNRNALPENLQGFGFDKILYNGEESVAVIDEKTKKIVDILTMEEARRLKIIDMHGIILNGLEASNNVQKEMYRGIEAERDLQIISLETTGHIMDLEFAEAEIQKEINNIKAEKLRQLGLSPQRTMDILDSNLQTIANNQNIANQIFDNLGLDQATVIAEIQARSQRIEDGQNAIALMELGLGQTYQTGGYKTLGGG